MKLPLAPDLRITSKPFTPEGMETVFEADPLGEEVIPPGSKHPVTETEKTQRLAAKQIERRRSLSETKLNFPSFNRVIPKDLSAFRQEKLRSGPPFG